MVPRGFHEALGSVLLSKSEPLNWTSLKNGGLKNGSGPAGTTWPGGDGMPNPVGDMTPDGTGESEPEGFVSANHRDGSLDDSASCAPDGSGDLRKRLAMPDTMMPGWRPRNGESSEIVPRIRCLKGLRDCGSTLGCVAQRRQHSGGWEGGRRRLTASTTSAASRPPMEWPTSITSVVSDS